LSNCTFTGILQLCTGQEGSILLERDQRHQTTNLSVCLISKEKPTWDNRFQMNNVTVAFIKRKHSAIYYSAMINVSNAENMNNSTLIFSNSHDSLEYHIVFAGNESKFSVYSSSSIFPHLSLNLEGRYSLKSRAFLVASLICYPVN
jgi:hypothetical protein